MGETEESSRCTVEIEAGRTMPRGPAQPSESGVRSLGLGQRGGCNCTARLRGHPAWWRSTPPAPSRLAPGAGSCGAIAVLAVPRWCAAPFRLPRTPKGICNLASAFPQPFRVPSILRSQAFRVPSILRRIRGCAGPRDVARMTDWPSVRPARAAPSYRSTTSTPTPRSRTAPGLRRAEPLDIRAPEMRQYWRRSRARRHLREMLETISCGICPHGAGTRSCRRAVSL